MDCDKCPIQQECIDAKKALVESYVEEFRPRLAYQVGKYCPLVNTAYSAISSRLFTMVEALDSYEHYFGDS
jgi:hypothetical protein